MLFLWLILLFIFSGFPILYYVYIRKYSYRPWGLDLNESYSPKITMLIPTFNEAPIIGFKLKNLSKLNYPKDLLQFIIIDSASTDGTLDEISNFVGRYPEMKIEVLREKSRSGKSMALNYALEYATGDVIIVSDADCFLPFDVLNKALPFLANPSVGAIVGREILLNENQSWVTRTEKAYRDFVFTLRLGESKFYSTVFFEGGFSAYKRAYLDEFDYEGADDSGTAFNIVQKNVRTILVPEAIFFTAFPKSWKGRITIKIRRASQLIRIWARCMNSLLRRKLHLPKRIALPEIFLYIFNPIIFVALVSATFFIVLEYPILLLFSPFFLVPKIRTLFIETVQDNCILLGALIFALLNKSFTIWTKAEDSRLYLTKDLLESKELV